MPLQIFHLAGAVYRVRTPPTPPSRMTSTQSISREAVVLAKGIKTKRGGDQLLLITASYG